MGLRGPGPREGSPPVLAGVQTTLPLGPCDPAEPVILEGQWPIGMLFRAMTGPDVWQMHLSAGP